MSDRRSPEAAAYRKLYNTTRWRRTRANQLAAQPLCEMCLPEIVTVATVCDHVSPHRGDEDKFWNGPFSSLCEHHHNRDKQIIERGGQPYDATPDADGFPTDSRHPFNRPR